jgi:hypothetical protein
MKNLFFYTLIFTNLIHPDHITIFAHGIVDNCQQINRFQEAISTPKTQSISFPDSLSPSNYNPINKLVFFVTQYFGKNMNYSSMFMGQKDDISVLEKQVAAINPKDQIVLFGCSRGAATVLSYLGQCNPTNIKAIVLDACPANMPETIRMNLAKVGINPNCYNTVFSTIFPNYDPETALTPLEAISKIQNKNLPILLMHSQEDSIVHYSNSLKLYQAFIDAGFSNVHLILLPKGKHSFLLQQQATKYAYLNAVHSFYKKYALPHNPELATTELTGNTLPKEVRQEEIEKYEQDIITTYDTSYKRNLNYAAIAVLLAILYKLILKK